MKTLAALALVLAGGCTRNAIFELELALPPTPAGEQRYAVVEARSDLGFDQDWPDGPRVGVPLVTTCAPVDPALPCDERALDPECTAVVSIVGDGDDLVRPLFVRVRFCADPSCAAPRDESAPEHRIEVERAFYVGRYTQARVCIDDVPLVTSPIPDRIERCEVRCRDGDATMHCRLDGTHFCEPPAAEP